MQINNAGSNAYSFKPLMEASDEDLIEVVSTNTLVLMICCREAINMMRHSLEVVISSTLMELVQMEDQLFLTTITMNHSG
ncbi:hypothetical protein ACS0TY_008244 [Phlomoides rotata]